MIVCVQRGCDAPLNRKTAVLTRNGPMCKRHADRIPPYLRRIGQLSEHEREALARLARIGRTSVARGAADRERTTP